MSRYQPYSSYKDSGVEWLGEVPEHWNFDKFRYIFNFSKGLTITKADLMETGIPCVNYGEVHSKYGFEISADKHELKCVDPLYLSSDKSSLMSFGDFVFADTSEDLDGAGNFTHVSDDTNIFAGYHTIIARQIKNNNSQFLAYMIDSKVFRTQIRLAVKGVKVFSITQAILRDATVWLPNIPEQTAIANFLDIQTIKIDTLIAKQERMIELLGEKRSALISHAVTKGIDPNVAMKDSGVKWLGKVPKHWKIIQSRRIFAERKDRAQEGDEQLTASQKHGIVSQQEFMELEGRRVVQVITGSEILKRAKENDFIISMRSFQGGLEWCKRIGSMSSAYIALIPIKHVIPQFFAYLFKSKPYIQALQSTSNLVRDGQALRFENFSLVDLVIIPDEEQRAIADYLDNQTTKIDTLITKARQAIELMKERRTALISAAVTGKIDVRGMA
jgi:type I restriction enzyme S subunit